MSYSERPTSAPGVVVWSRAAETAAERSLILPDGCLDVIWDGRRVFVAGPDSTARWHTSEPGSRYVALRFSAGVGACVLDVAANEIRDQTPDVSEVLSSRSARALTGGLQEDPAGTLTRWMHERLRTRPIQSLGFQIHALSASGVPVAELASRVGFSERQLRRRCEALFGYGPRRLGRILRLKRSVDAARSGLSLSAIAAECRYADQAHLSREVKALTGLTPAELLVAVAGR